MLTIKIVDLFEQYSYITNLGETRMGSKCCLPQDSNINILITKNNELRNFILQTLISLKHRSQWIQSIKQYIKIQHQQEYLYNFEYDTDINQLIASLDSTDKYMSLTVTSNQQFAKKLDKSCVVPEDEIDSASGGNINASSQNQINSFHLKMQKNPSLMMQFDTIIKPFIEQGPYKESLKVFLKWVSIAQKHLENGFLKPLYQIIVKYATKAMASIQTKDPEVVLKKLQLQISCFVNFMQKIYFQVYQLQKIVKSQKGKIFKEQNINHFIISKIFTTDNFNKTISDELVQRQISYIQGFQMKLSLLQTYSFDYFNIPPKFQLLSRNSILQQQSNAITSVNSYQSAINLLKKVLASKTPISKLKILLQVQKEIVKEIEHFYKQINEQPPEIDSDVITSLTMFVVVKSKVKELPTQLRIIETFASKNALNSISGYYISTFNVVISMIDAVQE